MEKPLKARSLQGELGPLGRGHPLDGFWKEPDSQSQDAGRTPASFLGQLSWSRVRPVFLGLGLLTGRGGPRSPLWGYSTWCDGVESKEEGRVVLGVGYPSLPACWVLGVLAASEGLDGCFPGLPSRPGATGAPS